MPQSTSRFGPIVVGMILVVGLTACSGEPPANAERTGESALASEGADEQARSEGGGEQMESESAGEHARSEGEGEGEHARSEGDGEHARSEGRGEHGDEGEGGEHDSEGEESGEYIGREDSWDATRNGARLALSFDSESNAFVGTVENTTERTLCAVRVEVHLSTGTELGPTERTDLPAGETTSVKLPTSGEVFETWTAHPEISSCAGG